MFLITIDIKFNNPRISKECNNEKAPVGALVNILVLLKFLQLRFASVVKNKKFTLRLNNE